MAACDQKSSEKISGLLVCFSVPGREIMASWFEFGEGNEYHEFEFQFHHLPKESANFFTVKNADAWRTFDSEQE